MNQLLATVDTANKINKLKLAKDLAVALAPTVIVVAVTVLVVKKLDKKSTD